MSERKKAECHPKYKVKQIYDRTWQICDNGIYMGNVYMYLLVGSERALLIDSGYGLLDLPEIIRTITDRPVICACTHGHIDHALGARQFGESYLHSLDRQVYEKHTSEELIRDACLTGFGMGVKKKILVDEGYQEMVQRMIDTEYPIPQPLENVKVFDLGDRHVSWRLVPGHTQGSTAFLDEENRIVFDGDGAPHNMWAFLQESSDLDTLERNLLDYYQWLQEKKITKRYVGHISFPLKPRQVQGLITCIHKSKKSSWSISMKCTLGNFRIIIGGGTVMSVPSDQKKDEG